jgi:plastocyanin
LDQAVVFLLPVDEAGQLVEDELASPSRDTAQVDQRRLVFSPGVLAVSPGTYVEFLNSDDVRHNVFKAIGPGQDMDMGTYPAGEARGAVFDQPGLYVMLCHVHPEMQAFVAVVPSEFRDVTSDGGAFEIRRVPEGRYVLRVWHPRRSLPDRLVEVVGGRVSEIEVRS